MNINSFEEFIESKIVVRGLNYYKCGHVESLDFEDGKWQAEVSGSDDYCVEVQVSEIGDILDAYCDCPYDFGAYCKHQVAVFYALRAFPEQEINISNKPKMSLSKILLAQSVEVLAAILTEYAENDKRIKSDLLLRFSDTESRVERARKLIQSSVKKAMHRGFVDYGHAAQAVEGADKVLGMIEVLDSAVDHVKLLIVVLEEMMDLLGCCDDSHGDVGGIIEDAVHKFSLVVSEFSGSQNEKAEIFHLAVNHASSCIYNGWEHWRINILEAFIPFCDDSELRECLEKQLKQCFLSKHDKSCAQGILANIISTFDGEDAADKYRADNLDNSDFRDVLIEKAISCNDLGAALNLCLDGEAVDAESRGLVKHWQKIRYNLHERMLDFTAQKDLARQFVLDGDFDYFAKFKTLYSTDSACEWSEILGRLLSDLDTHKRGVYVKILIAEDLKPSLMEYCRRNICSLTELYRYLLPDYEHELLPLFEALIRKSASAASNRSAYQSVCEIIRHFKKACGDAGAFAIINELLETYKRRPAFVDELRKIKN